MNHDCRSVAISLTPPLTCSELPGDRVCPERSAASSPLPPTPRVISGFWSPMDSAGVPTSDPFTLREEGPALRHEGNPACHERSRRAARSADGGEGSASHLRSFSPTENCSREALWLQPHQHPKPSTRAEALASGEVLRQRLQCLALSRGACFPFFLIGGEHSRFGQVNTGLVAVPLQ
jgi:hypothetical protein